MSGTLPPTQVNCAVNIRKAHAKVPIKVTIVQSRSLVTQCLINTL